MSPWEPSDSKRHTKKADTPKRKRQWSAVANSALASGKSEGTAVRMANAVVKKAKQKSKIKTTRRKK
jgi:hypothetical protein